MRFGIRPQNSHKSAPGVSSNAPQMDFKWRTRPYFKPTPDFSGAKFQPRTNPGFHDARRAVLNFWSAEYRRMLKIVCALEFLHCAMAAGPVLGAAPSRRHQECSQTELKCAAHASSQSLQCPRARHHREKNQEFLRNR